MSIGTCVDCGDNLWGSTVMECVMGHRQSVARTDLKQASFEGINRSNLAHTLTRFVKMLEDEDFPHNNFLIWYGSLLYQIDDAVDLPTDLEEEDDDDY